MRGAVVMAGLLMVLVGCSTDDVATNETAPTTMVPVAVTTTATTTATTTVTTGVPSTAGGVTTGVPAVTTPGTAPSDPVTPVGFDLVQATVTTAEGESCELCLWVASTAGERRQGLMGVTDLGEGDGMAFVYDAPHTGTFWMKNTLLPLSIAFFGPDGAFLDAFDMEPCTTGPCPRYRTAPEFQVAVETVQGELASLGIGAGSRLTLTDLPCE